MKTQPLHCNPEKGICELPERQNKAITAKNDMGKKPVKILYFTDPICSTCWGTEPQLRKLKLEYGEEFEIAYVMGGLLPDWTYNSGGISKPTDVAAHWDEVSTYYQMPIDGDVWLEDPLHSSYPSSIAFKAAQLQDEVKAILFLRRIREMVFLEKINIARWKHLFNAATQVGLDVARFKQDCEGQAKNLFQSDLDLAAKYGIRGFPTFLITGDSNHQRMLEGYKPYSSYESAIMEVYAKVRKRRYKKSWMNLFDKYKTLTTREFAELSDLSQPQSEAQLEKLTLEGKLSRFETKNGVLWKLKMIQINLRIFSE